MKLKELIPQCLKLKYKLIGRKIADSKDRTVFAGSKRTENPFTYSITETQPIRQSEYFQNKIDNIRLGAKRIEEYTIGPRETFSFWNSVGNPSPRRGYKIGRNLVGGKLEADYGGGLCQLSGIIYINALKAGLTITERHNHTVDIYTDEERFTPLGSDATVVYGYKDLRIINPYSFDIRLVFEIQDAYITCYLQTTEPVSEKKLEFRKKKYFSKVVVETFADNKHITDSVYTL